MKITGVVLDVIAPNECISCGTEGSILCAWCLPDAFEKLPERCYRCMRRSPSFAVCKQCRRETPLKHLWTTTVYSGVAKDLITHMKFNPDRSACEIVASQLDTQLPYFDDVVVSYIPTASIRVRQRGFDHAKIIARSFAKKRNLPFADFLVRHGKFRQVGSQREKRLAQVVGQYQAKNTANLKSQHVLLIDDIITTGATLSEAARTLKKAGAGQVDAAVFAQSI